MIRKTLFPPLKPRRTGHLDRGDGHSIYWEESGNSAGQPVVFLHGGPGAGTSSVHRRFFDPGACRIVLFDQRGCGKSRPFGETSDNSTQHLIGDIEVVRDHLGIDHWMVFGGSWGSMLALAYAERHPDRVRALILRGVFLGRQRELDWFLYGMRTIFPEAWHEFAEFLPEAERDDLLTNYHRRLIDTDPQVSVPAARRWSAYETACSTLVPKGRGGSHATVPAPGDALSPGDRWALGLARMEAHYFVNGMFVEDDDLLAGIDDVRGIPGTIVQGRYDVVCPITNADDLARAWPEADMVVVPDAGHSALEPGITSALVSATEKYKGL